MRQLVTADPYGHFVDARNASQDRARRDQEDAYTQRTRQEDRAFRESYAGAYGNQDFESARTIAAKHGNIEGVTAAASGAQQLDERQRSEAARSMQEGMAQWERIGQAQGQGYSEFRAQAIQAAQQNPHLRRIVDRMPEQWNPQVQGWLSGELNAMRRALLTPEQAFEQERDAARADREELRDERRYQNERDRIDQGERRLEAAIARGGEGPESWGPMPPQAAAQYGLTPEQALGYQYSSRGQIRPVRQPREQYYPDTAVSAANFANRMVAADQITTRLEQAGVNPASVWALGGGDRNAQSYRQAMREFVNAVLRRESGAAIAESEFRSAAQQYFPVPNDTPEQIAQKRAARARTIAGIRAQSQGAYDEFFGGGAAPPAGGAGGGSRPPNVPADYIQDASGNWHPPEAR